MQVILVWKIKGLCSFVVIVLHRFRFEGLCELTGFLVVETWTIFWFCRLKKKLMALFAHTAVCILFVMQVRGAWSCGLTCCLQVFACCAYRFLAFSV